MKTNLIIPKKCKVGFNTRNDTYTKKLGYVIFNDGKIWRKENSWESWREKYIPQEEFEQKKLEEYHRQINQLTTQGAYDFNIRKYNKLSQEEALQKLGPFESFTFRLHNQSPDPSIQPMEFENIPTEGFVLNKKAGGYSSGWNHRQTYCRVYDPRGFEFEISIPNLLYILENTNSIKGKGLEGKFVYSWDAKDLVLLPENAPEFQDIIQFNQNLNNKFKKKNLIPGKIYTLRNGQKATFLIEDDEYSYDGINQGKKLWTYIHNPNQDPTQEKYHSFRTQNTNQFISEEGMDPNYAFLMEKISEYDYYKKRETKFEQVTKEMIEKDDKNRTYPIYYVHEKGKYVDIGLNIFNVGYREKPIYFRKGRQIEEFNNLNELLNKYTLWKQIK